MAIAVGNDERNESENATAGMVSAAALSLASVATANAHPHVFAEARLDLTVGPDQTVRSLRHLWRFDDLFSSTVLMEFDKNSDLVLDARELDEVALTIDASLAEYNYFQLVTSNGKDVATAPPPKLIVSYENDQLVVRFETQPKDPLGLAGKVSIGVYDPTFYTAIDFADDHKIMVAGLPQVCSRSVVRPDPDTAIAQNQKSLTDAFFNDPTGTNLGKIFATRLERVSEAGPARSPCSKRWSNFNARSIWRSPSRSNCFRPAATGWRSWPSCRWASSSAPRMR
jgi:ABC-type uncharacterized transport system substrate-binding protein